MPMLITDPNQDDNPIVFVNDAFCRMTGYERAEILGRNCRFLQGPETDAGAVAQIRASLLKREAIEIELLNYFKNGQEFWNKLLIAPVFDETGNVQYFFASQYDITHERERLKRLKRDRDTLESEIERRTYDLSQSEQRLRFLMEAGRLGAWTLDLGTNRLFASARCKETFGRCESDDFGYDDLRATVHPDDLERMTASVAESVATKSDYNIEYRIITPAGVEKWVEIRGQPFYRADGTPLSMAGVSIDITERKRAEQHQALLAAELNHRVKNTLTVVSSIAGQTLRNSASIAEAQNALTGRLMALAAAHDVLTQEEWDGATLDRVVDKALAPFEAAAGRLKVGGTEVRLSPAIATAFALALHELATNAVKYGALSNAEGFVNVNWGTTQLNGLPVLVFRWQEVNGPEVRQPRTLGFGSRLIERALAEQLDGKADLKFNRDGLVFHVEAKLANTRQDGAYLLR
jgi:PAS domain S-box-containing protein